MKILFFASYPTLAIGYSRIGNILTNYLAELGHDVYYFGISNFGNNLIERHVHPSIKIIDAIEEEKKLGNNELYGVNSICDWITKLNPDILFLYNDIIVISRIFNNFVSRNIDESKFHTITYVDLVYPWEKIDILKFIDAHTDTFVVFGNYWKKNLIQMGFDDNKIKILPHGFDTDLFYQIDVADAKKYYGFELDDFVILNTNRNSYRKCIDKTIDAFIKFLKLKNSNPKIKLFLNMMMGGSGANDSGGDYDIMNCIKVACLRNQMDFNLVIRSHIFIKPTTKLSDLQQNYLYNACDIGINTCIGEGFGLCNLEHGGLGKPQIISNVGELSNIFDSTYSTPIEPIEQFYIPNNMDFHGGYGMICDTDDFVNAMIKYYDNEDLRIEHGKKSQDIITKRFDWNNILEELKNIINDEV